MGNGNSVQAVGFGRLLLGLLLLLAMLWVSRGGYNVPCLVVLTLLAVGWTVYAILGSTGLRFSTADGAIALFACLLVVLDLLLQDPTYYSTRGSRLTPLIPALASLGCLSAGWLARRPPRRYILLCVAVLLYGGFLGTELLRSPNPIIDVWSISTQATDTLLSGHNPYVPVYSDIYKEHGLPGYGYVMRYIYLPGLLMHLALPRVMGLDVRWMYVLAATLSFGLCAVEIRRRRSTPRHGRPFLIAGTAAIVFWYFGGQVFLIEQSWPEVLILFYAVLALWAWRRSAWVTGAALVLMLSLKQTSWFLVPFLLVPAVRQRRWRLIAGVAAASAVPIIVFLAWNPGAFLSCTIFDLLRKAPRPDSLSWSAVTLRHAPGLLAGVTALSFATYAAALGTLIYRSVRGGGRPLLDETLLWTVLGLFGFFLFLKQSFFNYYYLVAGLLAWLLVRVGADAASHSG